MVTCGRQPFNMLPMAPINPFVVGLTPSSVAAAAAAAAAAVAASTVNTTTTTVTSSASAVTKPRIAFSIDSIVGKEANQKRNIPSPSLSLSQRSESPEPLERSPSRSSYSADLQRGGLELRSNELPTQRGVIFCRRRASLDRSPLHSRGSVSPPLRRSRSRSPLVAYNRHGEERTPSTSPIPLSQQPHSPQLAVTASLNSVPPPPSSLSLPTKGPILVPGIPAGLLRPLPLPPAPNIALVAPPPPNSTTSTTGSTEPGAPTSQHLPGGHLHQSSSLPPPPPHGIQTHPPPPPNPHFLAAQFQMAAALAHHHHQQQQQQQHPGAHLPPGHPMGIFPPGPHHPHFGGPQLIRDSYPLYPWLLSRHGRIFPHRFPGNFLLQPFRKPKRVRTAFSPTQLLKLEHAFEGNHYVVGAERKQLAQGLSLTETQVKVWFQNRRTKHKRMQQEDGDTKSNKGSQAGDTEGKNDSSQNSFEDQEEEEDDEEIEDEDEVIDMDDYGSEIDAEEHQRIREQFQQQLQQHHQQIQQHMQQQQQHLQQREHQSQREQLQQRTEQQQQQSQHQQQQQQQQLLQQQQHHHFMQQQYFLQQQQQQQQQKQQQ